MYGSSLIKLIILRWAAQTNNISNKYQQQKEHSNYNSNIRII